VVWHGSSEDVEISPLLRRYWEIEREAVIGSNEIWILRPFKRVASRKLFQALTQMIVHLAHIGAKDRTLRGEVVYLGDTGWIFVGLPPFRRITDLEAMGLKLVDLPLHTGIGDLLVANQAASTSMEENKRIALRLTDVNKDLTKHRDELQRLVGQLKEEIERRERTEARLRLTQKLEAVGQLAAGVAHEINTPVQYVYSNLHFIKRAFDNISSELEKQILGEKRGDLEPSSELFEILEEIPCALEDSIEGLDRVKAIVRSMGEFAHPGGEGKTQVDVNHLIDTTLTLCRNEWKYVAKLELELEPDLPILLGNRDEIGQAILNIIVNAAHAIGMEEKEESMEILGRIRVCTRSVQNGLQIIVGDNGPGISTEIQERIFEPFFTTKEVGKGTGQGLALAYAYIVKGHKGTLTLNSAPGEGAEFVMTFPFSNDSEEEK
jgi:signal transduction histidine kinase